MKWFAVLVFGCTLCAGFTVERVSASPSSLFVTPAPATATERLKRQACTPGSTFLQDCNVCRCDGEGTAYACTQNECMEKGGNGDVEVFMENAEGKSSQNKTVVCKANTAFRKECNTCWCSEDGTSYFCTRKVCVPNLDDSIDQPEEMRVIEKECRPREVFELDCNTCRCNDNGQSFSCTNRACVSDIPPDAVDWSKDAAGTSSSGSRIKRQAESGKTAAKACEPGSQFRLDCNTCLCHTDGQSFACTRYDCTTTPPPPARAAEPASLRRRRRDVREEVRYCEPGSVFNQECNVCRCSADGHHATCTFKKCTAPRKADDTATIPESGFRCTPGEQFKRSCNDCTCSADGKSVFCTIKLCEKEIASDV